MEQNVKLNKIAIIERCLRRIHEVYNGNPSNLQDFTKQDSVILNIQRACEASIDLGMHIVSMKKLGIPQASRDAFTFLAQSEYISMDLAERMKKMVGFRNIAVHDYQQVNIIIVEKIITNHLDDFREYISEIMKID